MLQSIVLPLDGSSFSEQALPMAAAVARAAKAELHVVHVHFPRVFEGLPYSEQDQHWDMIAREQELEYLGELSRSVQPIAGAPVATQLLGDGVANALLEHARQVGAGLIVMSTHGRGGVHRAWLGSVADELVRRSHLPLLLVRPTGEEPVNLERLPAPRHFLVPLDGSALAEQILPRVTELGDLFEARYTLLRVVTQSFVPGSPYVARAIDQERLLREEREHEAESYLADLEQRLEHRGVRVDTEIGRGSPAATILERAATLGADVIAIATHGHGAALRALVGSVADKVVRGATIPVLVYRPERNGS